ncbi:protein LEKR1 [Gastrophryne carolinensis]
MEKHVPMHPLPEEIQMMPRDETVCKYCGVSYLILHEFKLLEDKLKSLEKELEFYHGSMEREKLLQQQLCSLSQEHDQIKIDREATIQRLQIAEMQLKTKENELHKFTNDLELCQQATRDAQEQNQLLGGKSAKQEEILKKTLMLLRLFQSEQKSIRKDIGAFISVYSVFKRNICCTIEDISKSHSAEIHGLQAHLSELQSVNVSLQSQLQDLCSEENEVKSRCHQQQMLILDLQQQLETLGLSYQNVTKEMQHHKDISVMKSKEVSDLQTKLQRREYDNESNTLRLQKELREKEDLVRHLQQKCQQFQEEITEIGSTGENYRRRTRCLESELATLKDILKQAQEEVAHLQQEREVQTISCQNRIEQLQETLRQRMLSDDSWETKIQNELETQKQKFMQKLEETERRFREEANIEVEIEKQRHNEVIRALQQKNQELEGKIPAMVSRASEKLEAEIAMFENKLQEAQARLTEKNQAKESEIATLKKIVGELEFRLKREYENNTSSIKEMRIENHKKTEQLKEINLNCTELRNQLDKVTQENAFLKETVRMECEERYELTEALTQAREQLFELKKVHGNFPTSQKFTPEKSLLSHMVTSLHQTHSLSSSASNGNTLVSLPRSTTSMMNRQRKSTSSTLPALQSPHPAKERVSSMTETRQKLTAVLRRNSSQP